MAITEIHTNLENLDLNPGSPPRSQIIKPRQRPPNIKIEKRDKRNKIRYNRRFTTFRNLKVITNLNKRLGKCKKRKRRSSNFRNLNGIGGEVNPYHLKVKAIRRIVSDKPNKNDG